MHRFLLPGLVTVSASVEWISATDQLSTEGSRIELADGAYDIAPSPPPAPTVRPDVYSSCVWAGPGQTRNQYDYAIKVLNTPNETDCSNCFPNFFAPGQPLAYPYPRSSYHYDLENAHVVPLKSDDVITVPNIEFDVTIDTSPDAGEPVSKTFFYDFKNFETYGPTILYNSIPHSVGVYNFNLVANDFDDIDSKVCQPCLSVTDMYRPNGKRGSCAESSYNHFTNSNICALQPQVTDLVKYRQTANNNPCSDARCDLVTLASMSFSGAQSTQDFSTTIVSDALDTWKTCLSQPLTDDEWTLLKTSVFGKSCEPTFFTCTRSCAYNIQLKEFYTPYSCAPTYNVESNRRTCDGDKNESCAFKQSITATPDDLISTFNVHLKSNPTKVPIAKPVNVFPGTSYKDPSDTSRELHFDIQCDSNDLDFGSFCQKKFQVNVTDLFELQATLNNDAAIQTLLKNRATNAKDIVFWRVKNTESGDWIEISSFTGNTKSPLTFPRFQSNLIFDAYTACGPLGSIKWTIYIHRTELIRIDDWWYSMWSCGAGKCNVQHTDFRLCNFHFDPKCDTFLSMINPTDAQNTIPVDEKGNAYNICEYKDNNGKKQTCSNGCWWWYSKCDQTVDCDSCNERVLQEGNRFAYCGPNGTYTLPQSGDSTDLLAANFLQNAPPAAPAPAPVPAPVVEVRIKWQFHGFQCKWQYTNAIETKTYWLDTTKDAANQKEINRDIALKMQNVDVTQVTAKCNFFFKSLNADPNSAPIVRNRTKTVLIQNCDHPRWNVKHPEDGGRYIKDTCNQVAWYTDLTKRQPAPFEACKGAMVFPDKPDCTTNNAVTTIYAEATNALTCCNSPTSCFTCQNLPGRESIGVCSDSKTKGVYYEGVQSSAVLLDLSQPYSTQVMVVVGMMAFAVAVIAVKRTTRSEEDVEDVYSLVLS
ncbi:hypothetical protein AeRB84_011000 [Aphanomyces euteiches]|nr:hypothetical protein AeRB84_011000 [Aphanomyces euteiches]